jgi:hypothetical protein
MDCNDELSPREIAALDREAAALTIAISDLVTPETVVQGFLSHRWKRRDGDIFTPSVPAPVRNG